MGSRKKRKGDEGGVFQVRGQEIAIPTTPEP